MWDQKMGNRRLASIPAIVIVLFLAGSVSGCKQRAEGAQTESVADSGVGVRIEVMVSAQNTLPNDLSKDIIKQELDKRLGIDLKITPHVGEEDYKNQWNLRIAGNSPPDLFYVDRRDMIKLSQQGSLLELTPYMDQLQHTLNLVHLVMLYQMVSLHYAFALGYSWKFHLRYLGYGLLRLHVRCSALF